MAWADASQQILVFLSLVQIKSWSRSRKFCSLCNLPARIAVLPQLMLLSDHPHFKAAFASAVYHLAPPLGQPRDHADNFLELVHHHHTGPVRLEGKTADEQVLSATALAQTLVEEVGTAHSRLVVCVKQLAVVEACFNAWKDGFNHLPNDWRAQSFDARQVRATEAELLRMLEWVLSRPSAADDLCKHSQVKVEPFDKPFLAEREELAKNCVAQKLFGDFHVTESVREFDHANEDMLKVSASYQSALKQMSKVERGAEHAGLISVAEGITQLGERAVAQEIQQLTEAASQVECDLKQLAAAQGQLSALQTCIDRTAADMDRYTSCIKKAFDSIERLQMQVAGLRPWKGEGASEEVCKGFR